MRLSILIGLLTTLSVVSCKEHLHQRDIVLPRRYKDNKNKRGIGDYSGLTYGGPSFQGFQTSPPTGVSFAQGFPSFGGYGGYGSYGEINSLGHSSFNLLPQSSGFSTIGTHNLGNNNLGQPLNIGPNSGLNFASLLGNSVNGQNSYSSPNTGLYPQMEKTGPVTFTSQGSMIAQSQPQYTPIYATGSQVGSNNYAIPVIVGSSQGSNLQGYRMSPSTLNSLNSQGLTISSSPISNAGSYSNSYLPLTGESSSHVVTGGYIMAASTPQQGTSGSYSIPISALTSAPSSSEYTMAIPASSYTSISSNPNYSNSSPSSSHQLPISTSTYTSGPSSSSGDYRKYVTSNDDNIYSTSNPMRTYSTTLKLENIVNPNTYYGSSSNPNSGYLNSVGENSAIAQSYSSNSLRAVPSKQSSYLVTSYGTPTLSYTIPSTSYGTPNNIQSISNSNYNSQSSVSTIPSISYTSSEAPSYSISGNTYSIPSSSSSYQTDSAYKNSGRTSSPINYLKPNTNYGSSTSTSSNDGNSVLNYKISSSGVKSNLPNSIENYSSPTSSNTYDGGSDSSSLYSNLSTRYLRYPANRSLPYTDNGESANLNYDTISYSLPNGK